MRSRFYLPTLLVALALLLSGCMRLKAEFTIGADDKVAVAMDIGLNKETATQAGTTKDDMCGGQAAGKTGINGKTESYDDGTYVGCRITGTVAISEMKGEGLTITKADGVYTFTWASGQAGGEAAGMSATMISDFRVAVTFPGKVLSHNGTSTVSGNTVTWTSAADLFASEGLVATGEAKASFTSLLVPIVIGLAVLALVGGIVWYLLARRKKAAAPVGAPYGQPGVAPQGYAGQYGPPAGNQPGGYPPAPGSYPSAPGSYPSAPGSYPSAPGAPGAYDDAFRPPQQSWDDQSGWNNQ